MPTEESHDYEIVEVLDKWFRVIFRGADEDAVEWICDHPLGPESVWLTECNDLMSIDDYLREWDLLNED
jgi:hypothetical protein